MEIDGHLKVNQHSNRDHMNLCLVLNLMKLVSMVKLLKLVIMTFIKLYFYFLFQ